MSLVTFVSGDGTLNDPYTLNNAEQLNEVRYYMSSHFKQVGDIDMSEVSDWIPIGYEEYDRISFSGSYDGGNFKIIGLNMNQPPFDFEWDDVPLGLFCLVDTDYFIKNIKLENINLTGAEATGALTARLFAGDITNCHSSGEIKTEGGGAIGGLVGAVVPQRVPVVNISECSSSVNIEIIFMEWVSNRNYGGLIGQVELDTYNGTSVINIVKCFATGSIRLGEIPSSVSEYSFIENFGGLIGSVIEMEQFDD